MSRGRKPYRYFLREEKEACIKCYLKEHLTMSEVARRYNISKGLLSAWLRQYREHSGPWGVKEDQYTVMDRILDKIHPYKVWETLDYWIQLEVENARLKKGYTVKGDGAEKEFVILSSRNFR